MDRAPNLLNVTTHQLQYLVAMDRADTLREAAEELGVSTSALSQALSELERRVGLALFERQGRARRLNPRGREMVALAERVLGATRDLTLWIQAATEGRRGSVRLGLIDIAAIGYLPDALVRFRAERPDVELHLTVAPSAGLVEQLSDGRLDLAVVVEPPDAPGIEHGQADIEHGQADIEHGQADIEHGQADIEHGQADVERGQAGVERGLAGVERGLAGHPGLVAIDLLAEELAVYGPPELAGRRLPPDRWGPWVTFPPGSHTRRLIAAAIRGLGIEFRVEAESHQPEVVRQLVNLGLGWTVLPVLQAEAEPNPLVRARRAPLLTRRLVVARRRSTPVDPVTADLIDRLRVPAGVARPA